MTYAQYSTIEASDYNNLVGANPTTSSGTLNAVWATGGTNVGYGQTAEGYVTVGTSVAATKWANLVNKTSNAALHQGTSITSVSAASTGQTISYVPAVTTNLASIYTNRLNASYQGSTTANTITNTNTWYQSSLFTHTVTFSSGDAARYFFNGGGQLKITCSHANTSAGINLLFNNLSSNIGTVVLSAPSTGSAIIAGTSYNGVTKIGGGGSTPTISTNSGYYNLYTSNITLFTQTASTGPSGYLSTSISIIAKTNGVQGSNGDAGNVITIYTLWDEVPDGLTVGTGSTTTLTIVPPENVYLSTQSWGTPTVTGTVTST